MGALKEFVDCFVERVRLTWTGFYTSERSPCAREVTPWAPLMVAFVVITFPFALSLPAEYWRFSYWGGGEGVNRMEVLRNFALIVAGLVGFWLAWWRLRLTDQQTKTAERDSKQKELDHVAARFERAVELLGSDKVQFQYFAAMQIFKMATKDPDTYQEEAIRLVCATIRALADKNEVCRDHDEPVHKAVRDMVMKVFDAAEAYEMRVGKPAPVDIQGAYIWDLNLTEKMIRGDYVRHCEFVWSSFSSCTFEGHFFKTSFLSETNLVNCDLRGGQFKECDFSGQQIVNCRVSGQTWIWCNCANTSFFSLKVEKRQVSFFRECNLTNAYFDVGDRGGDGCQLFDSDGVNNGLLYRCRDFEQCFVLEERVPVVALHNRPEIVARLLGERAGGGRFIVFRQSEITDEDVPTPTA